MMIRNALRFGLGLLALAALTCFGSRANAQGADFYLNTYSGTETLSVTATTVIQLFDPRSHWDSAKFDAILNGADHFFTVSFDYDVQGTSAWETYSCNAGTQHFSVLNKGTYPNADPWYGSAWQLYSGPLDVVVTPNQYNPSP